MNSIDFFIHVVCACCVRVCLCVSKSLPNDIYTHISDMDLKEFTIYYTFNMFSH